ncbi:hypothetical protein IH785_05165 [candidate division KSB1 bacterium]|nr:hypothetical protein [candidate division KSB1 bacterium]
MKNKFLIRLLFWQIIFLSIILFPISSFAQSSKINWDRMNRDLEIMQGVLDNLLAPSKPMLAFSNGGARGLYFDGYGVVFQIDLGGAPLMDVVRLRMGNEFELAKELSEQAKARAFEGKPVSVAPISDEGPVIVDAITGAVLTKEDLTTGKRIELLEERAIEFLRDYADAIGQIKPTDRITILANFEHNYGVFAVHLRGAENVEKSPSGLNITAKKSDIVDFRKGKIDEKTFRNRVTFHKRLDSKQKNRNIDIMANILNTALNRKHRGEFRMDSKNRGIYLDGLGALFFIRGYLLGERDVITYEYYLGKYLKEQEEMQASRVKTTIQSKSPEERIKESIKGFKDELVELVGDYGHTLRTLKPTEYVVVNINFKDNWRAHFLETPQQVILKVRKQDLDRYDRGELTLAALRKKVEIQEY